MACREEVIRKLDPDERRWVDNWQLVTVCLFLAIYVAIIVWWAVSSPADAATEAKQLPPAATHGEAMHASNGEGPRAP